MKKEILILLFFTITNLTFAQIAETNWIYLLDKDGRQNSSRQRSTITLKLMNKAGIEDYENLFSTLLAKNIRSGKIKIYKDEACTEVISLNEVEDYLTESITDTPTVFDPMGVEEDEFLIITTRNDILTSEKTTIRFKQQWIYDFERHQITVKIKSIAVEYRLAGDEMIRFFIKIPNSNQQATSDLLDNPDILIAKRIRYQGDFKGVNMDKYVFGEKHQAHNDMYFVGLEDFISIDKIPDNLGESLNTVITFDPETFEEQTNFIHTPPITPSEITDYSVVQDIYIDPERMNIYINLLAIAPTKPVFDDNDNFMYFYSLIWIVYDKAFLGD